MEDLDAFKSISEKDKKKKMLLIGIVACIVLIIFLALMVVYYKYVDAKTFKLYIDDTQVACSDDFYITDDSGNVYVKAKELASLIGWSYQNGEYGSFTEESSSGYLQNDYEISSFVSDSNELKKYIQVSSSVLTNTDDDDETITFETASENGTVETATLDLPIILVNDLIYFPIACLPDICNSSINYQNNRMYIYEQNYLINLAQNVAAERGYTSLSGVYENIRALAYGMCVVEKNDVYGVISIYNTNQILGFKYSDILFHQNVKEFFVKALGNDGEETVGIVGSDGVSIISPKSYENIDVLSDDLGLYLVEKNNQYGVLNRNGDVVVHAEYDSIGLSDSVVSAMNMSSEDNRYVLFDNTIVVEKDGKWGLFNIEGKQIYDPVFLQLGYDVSDDEDASKDFESVLTIEVQDLEMSDGTTRNIQAIVLEQGGINEDATYYGIYDAVSEKLIVPCICNRIYSVTKNGIKTYYIEWQDYKYEFNSYMASQPGIF